MANQIAPEPRNFPSTLQRGKACLRCRKRKMRCDGTKPACQQCARAKKADACEYDDGKGKTRTQLLRENIARLEQRIRELEDPEYTSPAVTLYDPHSRDSHSSSGSMSVSGSPPERSMSASHSPYGSDFTDSPAGSWNALPVSPQPRSRPVSQHLVVEQGVQSHSPVPFLNRFAVEEPPLPFELAQMLLDIFEPHRHQCGLNIHMGRLRESLSLPLSEQRHPALINAIFLWACFMSRPGPLSQHESHYLSKALEGLLDALQLPHRVLELIQASCLVSLYLLCNGRVHEGAYHSSAAASLAVQWGLHAGAAPSAPFGVADPVEPFKLEPAEDRIEEGERIMTFWQVYNLDRCWSVVLHRQPVIPDMPNSLSSIHVPWPLDIGDYESGQLDEGYHFPTIRRFLESHAATTTGGFSILSLRVKASALFGESNRLTEGVESGMMNPSAEAFQSLELAISQFISTLIPVHQLEAAVPDDRLTLIAVHSLAQGALIHLFYRAGQTDPLSYEKSLRAARASVDIIKHIQDSDYDLLDPIIGPCWTSVADTLIRELNNIEISWPMVHSADLRNELGTVLYALNGLVAKCPLLAFSTAKVQKRLAEM